MVDEIIANYVTFLFEGFTINGIKIQADTIVGYLRVVNKHYREKRFNEPFSLKDDSAAARMLRAQKAFEDEPARRRELPDGVLTKMCELAGQAHRHSFRACAWDFTGAGCFGGYREQEFAMASRQEIRWYVASDGTKIERAFLMDDFLPYDKYQIAIPPRQVVTNREAIVSLGNRYKIQKNRRNGQIIRYSRLHSRYRRFCPVEIGLDIIDRALQLGQSETDPLCVYRDEEGVLCYLTGTDMTQYYRFVTQLVMPNISAAELKLISTHSIRVKACTLLHEAGKDAPYIKIRLRWLSDCFEVYLRNTDVIVQQHGEALRDSHRRMLAMANDMAVDYDLVADEGEYDTDQEDIEDDD